MTQTEIDKSKAGARCVQLDGLRGLAIIFVVLSHCSILNQGGVANALFFVLSGFLFINPFKDSYEQRLLSVKGVMKYYKGRAVRILPTYYLVLLFIVAQTHFSVIPKDVFLKLLYFGQAFRHLWYLYSIVRVMLVIPLVFVVLLLLAKKIRFLNNDLVCAVLFLVLAGLVRWFYKSIGWYDIRLYQFMLGICFAYFFRSIRTHAKVSEAFKKCKIAGEVLISVIIGLIIASSNVVWGYFVPSKSEFYIGWEYTFAVGFVMGILVLLVSLFPDGLFGRFLGSKVMLFIGKLSLPVYLLNNFVIDQIQFESKVFQFMCVFSLCLVLAWIIDTLISKVISLFSNKSLFTK